MTRPTFGLDFVPITNERYFFACCQATLLLPEVDTIRVLLRTLGHSANAQLLPAEAGLEALADECGFISSHSPATRLCLLYHR